MSTLYYTNEQKFPDVGCCHRLLTGKNAGSICGKTVSRHCPFGLTCTGHIHCLHVGTFAYDEMKRVNDKLSKRGSNSEREKQFREILNECKNERTSERRKARTVSSWLVFTT